ncbi:hypothetical protein [Pelomonas cellulosilytica]|uniref:Uncharacterized protein n=1 Tax=Pelomonas cellulosilytica TaxID=2906762 RepID=A0ABS8Y5V9_9BURK|nr:hypothetical protein [Pelomonas sp. P8]MCE4557955.1 hypothetical protein [Pelomonas sp. P8]
MHGTLSRYTHLPAMSHVHLVARGVSGVNRAPEEPPTGGPRASQGLRFDIARVQRIRRYEARSHIANAPRFVIVKVN